MTLLTNTLRPVITGAYSPASGGSYHIDSIGGHVDFSWDAADLRDAYASGETLQDYLNKYIFYLLPRELRYYLDREFMELEFSSPDPARLNVIRAVVGGDIADGSFPLHVAVEFGYEPDWWEVRYIKEMAA